MNISSFSKLGIDIKDGGINIANIMITREQINNIIWKMVYIVITLIVMYAVVKIGQYLIDKTVKKQNQMRFSLDEKKARTLGAVLSSILRYVIYFFGICAIITQLFGNISLTFASIGGVAIGFGAQSLVKDVINGIFILFEDQFSVGDFINIDSKSGIVESIELRITKIRDMNGDLHIIPNGLITQVTNHSRGDMRVLVDIDISHEEDIDKVIHIIQEACNNFKIENKNMVEGPNVSGIAALKDTGITVRVQGKAKSMTQWECENALRRHLKVTLDKENIEIAYPRRKIIN
jgi:Small-conductance mechanosensitive channel